MKILFTNILLLLLIFTHCHSQKRIYFNPDSTKTVEVTCTHAKLDTDGNPENLKWIILQQHSPSSFIFTSDTCITETIQGHLFSITTHTTNSFNYTYFSVFAVDSANNNSNCHFSTHPNAAYGGWILVPDKFLPASPSSLNILF